MNERRNFTYSSKDRSHRYLRNHCRGPQRDERLHPPQTERERIRERDSAKYLILEIEKRKKKQSSQRFLGFPNWRRGRKWRLVHPEGKNVLQVVANLFNWKEGRARRWNYLAKCVNRPFPARETRLPAIIECTSILCSDSVQSSGRLCVTRVLNALSFEKWPANFISQLSSCACDSTLHR